MSLKREMFVAFALGIALPSAAQNAAEPNYVHVRAKIEVGVAYVSAPGDVMGVYALELLPCASQTKLSARKPTLLERMRDAFFQPAHANHRERFDGPAMAQVQQPLLLDRAQTLRVSQFSAPLTRYCSVTLTLARLAAPAAHGPLPTSLRMAAGEGRAPLALNFAQPLTVALASPWQAEECNAELKIELRPNAARAILSEATQDFGTLSQRVVNALSAAAQARVACQKAG